MACRPPFSWVTLWSVMLAVPPALAYAERLPVKLYSTAEGLSSSVVLDVVPDSRGFVWFATRSGLDRFDGTAFRNYTTEDGLPNPVVNSLLETRNGEYWVATNGGGVCRFDVAAPRDGASQSRNASPAGSSLFECQNVGTHFQSNRVNVLREDRQGRIVMTTDNGVFRVNRRGRQWSIESVALHGMPDAVARAASAIHEDRTGHLWIGLRHGILRLADGDAATLYRFEGRDLHTVRAIAEDNGVLLLAARFGLVAWRPPDAANTTSRVQTVVVPIGVSCVRRAPRHLSWPATPGAACVSGVDAGLPHDHVQYMLRSPNGRLWMATPGGLAYAEHTQVTSLASAENLSAPGYYALAQPRDGVLWIGTARGAMKFTLDGLVSYTPEDGLGDAPVRTLLEGAGGLFVVSGNWVVNRFDGTRFQSVRAPVPEGAATRYGSRQVFLDNANRWWLMTDRGLHRLHDGATFEQVATRPAETIYGTDRGLPADGVTRLFEDSRGDLWIATRSATTTANVFRWFRSDDRIEPVSDVGSAARFPTAFVEDRRGALWVGFESGVLARYREGRFRTFGIADGVPLDIADLHLDARGRLWIASGEGLWLLEDTAAESLRLLSFTTNDGLATNGLRCLAEDQWGRIYVGTSRGVDRFDPTTRQIKHLTTADGLAADFVTAAFRDRTGVLWFGTNEGVSRLVPILDSPSPRPRVYFGEVRAGGAVVATPELGTANLTGLELAPGQNHLQIAYFGLASGTDGALRYRYRLGGSDETWTALTDRRDVHYASLAPGSYQFVVEAVAADGATSDPPAVLHFVVLPPIWLRWWFLTLMASTLAAAASVAYRYRVARLVELERVRTRIAADLHDDIAGNLSRIAIHSEVARQDEAGRSASTDRHFRDIAITARDTASALGDVVWSVDPQQDDLGSLERRLRAYAADLLGEQGVQWSFHGAASDDLRLNPQPRRDLFLLLKEAVTNVARHARARTVSLHAQKTASDLRLVLTDDGIGFDAETTPSGTGGRGLANMRARAERLGAQLVIETSPGAGTRVTLSVPTSALSRTHVRRA